MRTPRGRQFAVRVRMLTRRQLLLAVGIVALAVRLPYIIGPVDGQTQSDSGIYLGMAHDLLHGHGFATGGEFRTPGYPILLAALSFLPGSVAGTAVTFQHLLGVAAAVGLTWATWRFFGRCAAVLAGALAALSPALLNLEGDALPDFIFCVVVLTGAFALARALEDPQPATRWLAAAGVIFGIAALVKPVGQALLVAAAVPLLVSLRQPRTWLRAGAIIAGCMLLTVSPWIARNAIEHGDVRMSIQDGLNLWLREFDYDKRPFPTSTPRDRLAKHLYEKNGGLSSQAPTNTYELVFTDLVHHYGYSARRAAFFERAVAIQAIRASPLAYLEGTAKISAHLAWDAHTVAPARLGIDEKVKAARPRLGTTVSSGLFDLSQVVVYAWFVLSLGLLSVLLVIFTGPRRQRVAAVALGVVWVALTVSTGLAGIPDSRYASANVPLIWLLGSAGAAAVLSAGWNVISSARRNRRA